MVLAGYRLNDVLPLRFLDPEIIIAQLDVGQNDIFR
jgi:hypothetical protein